MTFLPWYSTILWSATTSVSTFFSRLTADLGIRFFFNFNFPWDLMCLVLSLTDLSFFSNISIKIHFIINKSKSIGVFILSNQLLIWNQYSNKTPTYLWHHSGHYPLGTALMIVCRQHGGVPCHCHYLYHSTEVQQNNPHLVFEIFRAVNISSKMSQISIHKYNLLIGNMININSVANISMYPMKNLIQIVKLDVSNIFYNNISIR